MLYRMIGVAMLAGAFAASGCGGSGDDDGAGATDGAGGDDGSVPEVPEGSGTYQPPGSYETPPASYETPAPSNQTPPSSYQPPGQGAYDLSGNDGNQGRPCTIEGDLCQGCLDDCDTCICALSEENCDDLCGVPEE